MPNSTNYDANENPTGGSPSFSLPSDRQITGRKIVVMEDMSTKKMQKKLNNIAGVNVVGASSDASLSHFESAALGEGEAVVFNMLGMAVMNSEPDQNMALTASLSETKSGVLAVEDEEILHALSPDGYGEDFLEGYRAGVNNLVDSIVYGDSRPDYDAPDGGYYEQEPKSRGADTGAFTWGLNASGAATSPYTGKGVRVAVLDTGMDLEHPDFAGRDIQHASFILGESVQDKQGHGTHCIGVACGPRTADGQPGYGVASDVDIFAGKVLSNRGSGTDTGILQGIEWALRNECDIISMSLGARTRRGDPYGVRYEKAAQMALKQDAIIVAAAGNERADGPDYVVASPANAPSIYAVGAVDVNLNPARFSNISSGAHGGQVDISGPGVGILSSVPMPRRYRRLNGTSMATPHVAGILALLAEAFPGYRGRDLLSLLLEYSERLDAPATLTGLGMVRAPQN